MSDVPESLPPPQTQPPLQAQPPPHTQPIQPTPTSLHSVGSAIPIPMLHRQLSLQNQPRPPSHLPSMAPHLVPIVLGQQGEDDVDGNTVVETDPTGRFERYAVCLGRGAYKEVYKAFDQEEGVEVAWNQLRLENFQRKDTLRLVSEIQILQSLRNPHIINLFYHWTTKTPDGLDHITFITELMTSGTLKSYVRKTKGTFNSSSYLMKGLIKPKILKSWARQIGLGLAYLHGHDPVIIHRDLKCDNIFINGNNGQAKIGDLGHATFKSREHVSSVLGTPEFMAPELYDEKYDEQVDIYAYGMVLLEIYTKEYPYSECTNQAQIYKKVQGLVLFLTQRSHQASNHSHSNASKTTKHEKGCLAFTANERPSAREVVESKFCSLASIGEGSADALSLPTPILAMSSHSIDKEDEEETTNNQLTLRHSVIIESSTHTYNVKSPPPLSSSYTSSLPTETTLLTVTPVFTSSQTPIDEQILLLKMTLTHPPKPPQEITFPFNLAADTATDVVNEMVLEMLVDIKDEQLARRRIEECVRGVLIQTRSGREDKVGTSQTEVTMDYRETSQTENEEKSKELDEEKEIEIQEKEIEKEIQKEKEIEEEEKRLEDVILPTPELTYQDPFHLLSHLTLFQSPVLPTHTPTLLHPINLSHSVEFDSLQQLISESQAAFEPLANEDKRVFLPLDVYDLQSKNLNAFKLDQTSLSHQDQTSLELNSHQDISLLLALNAPTNTSLQPTHPILPTIDSPLSASTTTPDTLSHDATKPEKTIDLALQKRLAALQEANLESFNLSQKRDVKPVGMGAMLHSITTGTGVSVGAGDSAYSPILEQPHLDGSLVWRGMQRNEHDPVSLVKDDLDIPSARDLLE